MDEDYDMETVAVKGSKMEKAARKRSRMIRKAKELAGISTWEREDEIEPEMVIEKLEGVLEFIDHQLVTSQMTTAEHKAVHNGLVTAILTLKKVEKKNDKKTIKKI